MQHKTIEDDQDDNGDQVQEVHLVLASNDPGRAYSSLVLALGAIAMGAKCKLNCTMGALDIVRKGGASKIVMPGVPPLEKYLHDAINAGVIVTACGPTKDFLLQLGITSDNLEQEVEFEDVIGFLNAALPASKEGGLVLFI